MPRKTLFPAAKMAAYNFLDAAIKSEKMPFKSRGQDDALHMYTVPPALCHGIGLPVVHRVSARNDQPEFISLRVNDVTDAEWSADIFLPDGDGFTLYCSIVVPIPSAKAVKSKAALAVRLAIAALESATEE